MLEDMQVERRGWWSTYLRPRDVFIWGTVCLLLGLAALVWTTRGASDDVLATLSLIMGGVGTLGGYYQGHKGADEAQARTDAAEATLQELQRELRRAREALADANAELHNAWPLVDKDERDRKKE